MKDYNIFHVYGNYSRGLFPIPKIDLSSPIYYGGKSSKSRRKKK